MSKILVALDVDLTLMVMDGNGDHHPSSVMTFQYFIATDEQFLSNLEQNSIDLMTALYREHYDTFKLREPNDPNYIWFVAIRPKVIPASEFNGEPWTKGKCPFWESSNLLRADNPGFEKLSPDDFRRLIV